MGDSREVLDSRTAGVDGRKNQENDGSSTSSEVKVCDTNNRSFKEKATDVVNEETRCNRDREHNSNIGEASNPDKWETTNKSCDGLQVDKLSQNFIGLTNNGDMKAQENENIRCVTNSYEAGLMGETNIGPRSYGLDHDGLYKKNDKDNKPLQHLPFSPATNPGFPGRLVTRDKFPGRLVARDRSSGKARRGYLPGRHRGAHTVSV
ncbi:hypothetical protein Tco_0036927, partial [Tanacetum coccineum]